MRTLLLAAALLAGCTSKTEPHGTPIGADSAPSKPKAPPKEPTMVEKLKGTQLLPDAIKLVAPALKDTVNEPDPGTSMLALWMGDHPSWSAIERLPETSHARVLKDSEAERGKHICVRGTVAQIAKEQGTKLFSGTLVSDDGKPFFYIAAASTGDLLENSRARFCGVVTSRYSYSNVSGGTTHAVRLVGLFDLPENRKL